MRHLSSYLQRWKEVILITVSIRFLIYIFTFLVTGKSWENFFSIWIQWDGPHYLDIARHWYVTGGLEKNWIVFYPLYPILIKLFSFITGNFSVSSIYISFVLSMSSSILLYELARLDLDNKKSILSVWFLNIFPTSYFLQASYTESLFLTVSLASIYYFRKNKSFKSGIFAALASFSRINGLLLIPLFLFEQKPLKRITALILAPFGFLTYCLINYSIFKDPFYFQKPLLSYWHKKLDWPWIGFKVWWQALPNFEPDVKFAYALEMVAIVLLVYAMIYSFLKIRKSYGIYTLANLVLITSTSFILSTPRYALIIFPIYLTLAQRNRYIIFITSLIFLTLLFYFSAMYTKGAWAF